MSRFDAAWNGDLETIKTLTLTPWDDAKEEAPLKIAVQDQNHNDPFSLAFSRKHYDVAKAILEITQAQYTSVEKPKTRYRMQTENDSECSDEDSDDDDARPRIQSEIFNDQLTIDNVGKVSMKVDSHTKPLELLHWTSPLTSMWMEKPLLLVSAIFFFRYHPLFSFSFAVSSSERFNRLTGSQRSFR